MGSISGDRGMGSGVGWRTCAVRDGGVSAVSKNKGVGK